MERNDTAISGKNAKLSISTDGEDFHEVPTLIYDETVVKRPNRKSRRSRPTYLSPRQQGKRKEQQDRFLARLFGADLRSLHKESPPLTEEMLLEAAKTIADDEPNYGPEWRIEDLSGSPLLTANQRKAKRRAKRGKK